MGRLTRALDVFTAILNVELRRRIYLRSPNEWEWENVIWPIWSENLVFLARITSISGPSCSDLNKSWNSFDRHRSAEQKMKRNFRWEVFAMRCGSFSFKWTEGRASSFYSLICSSIMLLSGEITRTLKFGFEDCLHMKHLECWRYVDIWLSTLLLC